jgi:small subunit ribosomal protein S1
MQEFMGDNAPVLRGLRRGDIAEGVVMRVDRDGVLVDIGLKSEGYIPLSEMRSLSPEGLNQLKIGDQMLVYVMNIEGESQVLLSVDRARGEKGWHTLQRCFEKGECFDATIVGCNKGGLLVDVEGVRGFVPVSQVIRPEVSSETQGENRLSQMVGKQFRLKVIEIDRRRNRLILSERAALHDWRNEQKERLLQELKEGEIRRGRVTGIRNFGIFVDLGGADGLVHISEVSWDRTKSPEEVVKVGDEVSIYVMKVNPETKKIALSLRRAQPEPWETIIDKYRVGQLVTGTITKLASFGAFARLEGPIEGLIHISELADRRIEHPKEVVKEGDVLTLKVLRIEPERRRLGLSLRQAQEEAGAGSPGD